jgi:hypothetical protein
VVCVRADQNESLIKVEPFFKGVGELVLIKFNKLFRRFPFKRAGVNGLNFTLPPRSSPQKVLAAKHFVLEG